MTPGILGGIMFALLSIGFAAYWGSVFPNSLPAVASTSIVVRTIKRHTYGTLGFAAGCLIVAANLADK